MSDINYSDIKFGEVAERLFEKYYKGVGNGRKYHIRDTTKSKYHRKLGVDFEVVSIEEQRQYLVEVKHQKGIYYSGEIVFETLNEYQYGKQNGWLNTSQADELYVLESKVVGGSAKPIGFHCFKFKPLRKLLRQDESLQERYINGSTKAFKVDVWYLKKQLGADYWYEDLSQYDLEIPMKATGSLKMGNKKGLATCNN